MPDYTIDSIFKDTSIRHSLELFSEPDIDAVESLLTGKNGKPYVKCLASGKDRPAKPEEIVRQLWIRRLMKRYKYPASRLAVEFPITFGRDTSKRADIVVFDVDRPNVPYVIVEVKQTKLKDGKDQLKSATPPARPSGSGPTEVRSTSTTARTPITSSNCRTCPPPRRPTRHSAGSTYRERRTWRPALEISLCTKAGSPTPNGCSRKARPRI